MLPTNQEEIRALKEVLKEEIKERERTLKTLQTWCKHPNMQKGDYLARKGWEKCTDCDYWDEWWL